MTRSVLYLFGICLFLLCVNSAAPGKGRSHSTDTESPLNLRDFGAVGDGVADDGPAFQSALDALAAAGGGTLFIPEGKYAIVTPVAKDFTGLASSITIMGVESLTPVPPPSATGEELSAGLDLHTEVYPRTDDKVAIHIKGLNNLVVKDIAFVGTATVGTDAQITLLFTEIGKAKVQHSEFYALATLLGGGAIVEAIRSDLEVTQCKFLGSTGNSGEYVPVIQNLEWYGITVTDTIFLDYGQRELFSKTGLAAPISWINIGNAAQDTNVSPRREVVLRKIFLDEGGYWGLSGLPSRYLPPSAPIDLLYISGLEMNVSNFGQYGHLLYDVDRVMVERSRYGWSHLAAAAMALNNVGTAILDQVKLEASADHIFADANTRELSVINSTNVHLDSSAQSTVTINTEPEDDPVQFVRSRFIEVLGREPDPAAHFYWSNSLILCLEDVPCQDAAKQTLSTYLASHPSPNFMISGRIAKPDNTPAAGVKVTLSGSQAVVTNTDSNGNYFFANLPTSGHYVVTPTSDDYNLTFAEFTTPNGNRVANFTTKPKTYFLTGTVRKAGSPVAGVEVAISGSTRATTVSNTDGEYSFELLKGGSYVVTPTPTKFNFSPGWYTINSLNGDAQIDFDVVPPRYSITGRVVKNGTPLAGVSMTLAGPGTATTMTASDGTYAFNGIEENSNVTVTAAKDLFAFSPSAQSFVNIVGNKVANFEAVHLPVLLTEADSDRAVAMELTQWVPEPFSITTTLLSDGRNTTRIIMFATDLNLLPGEGIEAMTAEAEDTQQVIHPLRVEFVSPLPALPQINQVVVRLTRDLDHAGDVLITLKVHGLTSNKARIIVGTVNDDSN